MSNFDIDSDLIRELAALLEETGLGEIEIQEADRRIRIARPAVAAQAMTAAPAATAPATPVPVAVAEEPLDSHPGALTSPMVGTAYLAPEPGAPAFVDVGQSVRRGQTVMVVEAMKTFNEIPAPRDGTVTRILAENAAPVEFGEVLMIIE